MRTRRNGGDGRNRTVINCLRGSSLSFQLHPRIGPSVLNRTALCRLSADCSATELRKDGGLVRSRTTPPKGTVLQTACRSHRLSQPKKLVPQRGIEPRSRLYQSRILSLNDRGGGEPSTRNSQPCDCALFSKQAREPSRLTLQMAEGEGIEPLARRLPWFSRPVAGHSAAPSVNWYWRRDSNPHCPRSERGDSCRLVYASMVRAARFERALSTLSTLFLCLLGYARELVSHGGFDPAFSTLRGWRPSQ
jgi:hypothetical protein